MSRQQLFTLRIVFHNFHLILQDCGFVLADLLIEAFLWVVRELASRLALETLIFLINNEGDSDHTYKVSSTEAMRSMTCRNVQRLVSAAIQFILFYFSYLMMMCSAENKQRAWKFCWIKNFYPWHFLLKTNEILVFVRKLIFDRLKKQSDGESIGKGFWDWLRQGFDAEFYGHHQNNRKSDFNFQQRIHGLLWWKQEAGERFVQLGDSIQYFKCVSFNLMNNN